MSEYQTMLSKDQIEAFKELKNAFEWSLNSINKVLDGGLSQNELYDIVKEILHDHCSLFDKPFGDRINQHTEKAFETLNILKEQLRD